MNVPSLLTACPAHGQPCPVGAAAPRPWRRRPGRGEQDPETGTGPSADPGVRSRGKTAAAGPEHGAGHSFLWPSPAARRCPRLSSCPPSPLPPCPTRYAAPPAGATTSSLDLALLAQPASLVPCCHSYPALPALLVVTMPMLPCLPGRVAHAHACHAAHAHALWIGR